MAVYILKHYTMKTSINHLTVVVICISVLMGCTPKKEIQANLKFGHRGSGAGVYEQKLIENTVPSVLYALTRLDGCEIDIQMSQDGTIWVYHDDNLNHFCDTTKTPVCIPKSSDLFIESTMQCREGVRDRIYRLEEILKLFNENDFATKFLSLDVKGYFQTTCFEARNAPEQYFEEMAANFCSIVTKYKLSNQLIIETNYTNFMDFVKEQIPNISCHLIGYEDFDDKVEKALAKNYEGISFSMFSDDLNAAAISKARNLGLEVQIWPINNQEMLQRAKKLNPFAMQLSKVSF